ncbi:winged helix-turn-helix domain-containing protein [Pseudarthrobacter sp. NamE5]|uniref:winged helix-turn-helix domain-containing protein n=1 Tax=Pseudarthrobacter sp. NamE5 TaxID=2576839 RepID=UPI0026A69A59
MAAESRGGSPGKPSHSTDTSGGGRQETPRSHPGGPARPAWTFLTNHGHVLLSVARDPEIRVADIAERVGITTRAALLILKDLDDGGYLQRTKVGRRTRYTIRPHQHFRHPTTAAQEVDGLIRLFPGAVPDDGPASESGGAPGDGPALDSGQGLEGRQGAPANHQQAPG